jgi:hypothetical protein
MGSNHLSGKGALLRALSRPRPEAEGVSALNMPLQTVLVSVIAGCRLEFRAQKSGLSACGTAESIPEYH